MAELEPTDEALVEELVRAAYTAAAIAIGLGALDFSALSPTGKAQWYASIRAILPILNREVAKAKADAEAANQRAAHAEHRLYSFRQGRAARSKVMADYIKAKCPELWPDYAALSVNGSLYSDDLTIEPVYEREMNTLRHRAETAEDRATAAKADAEMLAGALERIANHRYDAGGAYEMTMIARQALATYRETYNGSR